MTSTTGAGTTGATRSTGTTASTTDSLWTGRLAVTYGTLAALIGAWQTARPPGDLATIEPLTRWLLVVFTVSLLVLAPLHLMMARFARSPWGARVAAVGTPILATGSLSSAVNGADLPWFPVVAVVGNALWLVGSTALGVSLFRAGRVPRWVAVLLPLTMPVTLFASQLGGALLGGAFWLAVGALALRGVLARRGTPGTAGAA